MVTYFRMGCNIMCKRKCLYCRYFPANDIKWWFINSLRLPQYIDIFIAEGFEDFETILEVELKWWFNWNEYYSTRTSLNIMQSVKQIKASYGNRYGFIWDRKWLYIVVKGWIWTTYIKNYMVYKLIGNQIMNMNWNIIMTMKMKKMRLNV